MNTSKKGKALIKKYEGCRLKAYKCPAGVLTIGYGHTNNVRLDDVLTQDEAEKLLDIDIKIKENELNKLIKVPVTQNQYDALISLLFNIGVGNFRTSTLLRLLNQKNYKGAGERFLLVNNSAKTKEDKYRGSFVFDNRKKVLDGLVKRRAEEKELFLS